MKAFTIGAAAAGLIGAVSAGHEHVHERLHARDEWEGWTTTSDPATTSSDWVYDPDWTTSSTTTATTTTPGWVYDPDTTSTSSTAMVWDPWTTSSTTTKTTTTPMVWDPWTTTTTASTTTTIPGWEFDPVDPADCSASTVTDWALGTTTVTSTAITTISLAWNWASGTFTSTAWVTVTGAAAATSAWGWEEDPSLCKPTTLTSTGMPIWLPVADPATTIDWTSYTTLTVTPVEWTEWTVSTLADPTTAWAWPTTTTAVSTTTSTATSWPTSTGHAVISPAGSRWSMTYSPYTAQSGCKDQGTIAADIAIIAGKGFTSVRVYSTDCQTLQFVGDACRANGLKMILGIYISDTGINGAYGQLTDILAWAQWDIVELIVVGNEAVFSGYCSASDLAWFISDVKTKCAAAGYTGPCTTTEPLATWQADGSTFCSVVDVLAANLYAFFNAETTCDQAGSFIQSEIEILSGICPGLEAYVMETGWPSAGSCNGVACPGWTEQATAITSIEDVVGAKVVFFTYEDDLWKAPGAFGVEQHWGCASVF